jgi:calcineurin-like phosphoesterase family protein
MSSISALTRRGPPKVLSPGTLPPVSSPLLADNSLMKSSYLVSDTHFGHANIVAFLDADGNKIRPFSSVEEMDEVLVSRWNAVVRPGDRVYHLGDVVMNRRCLPILDRLNGRKVLVKGNHDIFQLKDYVKYFDDIRAYKVFPSHGIICSHVPVHDGQLRERFTLNVHGHLHQNTLADGRYLNVCVEQTGYAPVPLDDILNDPSRRETNRESAKRREA